MNTQNERPDLGKSDLGRDKSGAAVNLKPHNISKTENCQPPDVFVPIGRYAPVEKIILGDVMTIIDADKSGPYDSTNQVRSLRVLVEDGILYATGFMGTRSGLHRFWTLTHNGPFTIIWEMGQEVTL